MSKVVKDDKYAGIKLVKVEKELKIAKQTIKTLDKENAKLEKSNRTYKVSKVNLKNKIKALNKKAKKKEK